jgi:cell wall assembly regulator SMI1
MDNIRRMKMNIWQMIKDWFGYNPADEFNKIKDTAQKEVLAIEAKIEQEVKTKVKKVKEKLDVNKDGDVNVEDVKEVVKKATRKKK